MGWASQGQPGDSRVDARQGRRGWCNERAQVAACFWQGPLLIFFGWVSLPVWKRCNAGRKFFKRLNYYCFLCGCLRWCMKKSFKGTWKEICLNSRVVVIHPLLPVGIWPISSGKWLIRTCGFIRGLNIRCHKGD
jgi:hypothetical protein